MLKGQTCWDIYHEPYLSPSLTKYFARLARKPQPPFAKPAPITLLSIDKPPLGDWSQIKPREEAPGLIRGLIDRIVLTPDASKTRLIVDLEGDLAGILAMSADQASLKTSDLLENDTFGAFSSLSYRLGESVSHEVVGINGCGSRI